MAALAQPRAQPLAAADLLLLSSFVRRTGSFRAATESFSPVCLPRYNASAFLHAYVAYFDQVWSPHYVACDDASSFARTVSFVGCCISCQKYNMMMPCQTLVLKYPITLNPRPQCHAMQEAEVCLVLLATSADAFFSLSDAAAQLKAELRTSGFMQACQGSRV